MAERTVGAAVCMRGGVGCGRELTGSLISDYCRGRRWYDVHLGGKRGCKAMAWENASKEHGMPVYFRTLEREASRAAKS